MCRTLLADHIVQSICVQRSLSTLIPSLSLVNSTSRTFIKLHLKVGRGFRIPFIYSKSLFSLKCITSTLRTKAIKGLPQPVIGNALSPKGFVLSRVGRGAGGCRPHDAAGLTSESCWALQLTPTAEPNLDPE